MKNNFIFYFFFIYIFIRDIKRSFWDCDPRTAVLYHGTEVLINVTKKICFENVSSKDNAMICLCKNQLLQSRILIYDDLPYIWALYRKKIKIVLILNL